MTTSAVPHRPASLPNRLSEWAGSHRQLTTYLGVGLVVAGGLFWWNYVSTRRSEAVARDELLQARAAFESKNWALAASELSRISENYSGTSAAEEGTLLLAQVRMMQGQAQQAIAILKDFAPGASKAYRAQAYGLLGAAYENVAHPKEAAETYQVAAEAARMDFLQAQFLSDAGRAYVAAGDTASALGVYRRIVADYRETGPYAEALVRIGELTKGAFER